MSLNTTIPGYLAIGELPENVIFGTAQIGDDFGTVKSATLDRTGDTEEILNGNGGLRTLLINNPRSEFSLDTLFTSDVEAPGLGELIAFPLLADTLGNPVCGSILKVTVKWEEKGARMLTITATNWDSLGARPTAKSFDPATGTWSAVEQTVALPDIIED
jgi:hypothetical protein